MPAKRTGGGNCASVVSTARRAEATSPWCLASDERASMKVLPACVPNCRTTGPVMKQVGMLLGVQKKSLEGVSGITFKRCERCGD